MITDFHIHSKYSRACSKYLDLTHIEHWCKIKGIDVAACADFTHPAWFKEISTKLEPEGNGFFRLKDPDPVEYGKAINPANPKHVRFLLGTEIACIYSQGGQVRRVHLLILFPEMEHVKTFIEKLQERGAKLASDGRPILGISARDIAAICFDISEYSMVIPAHVWTPWFAVFGSKSGFDSVEECFEDYAPYIHALETGLSSDPKMNWQLSKNDRYALVSNSDAHSLENLGREANVFRLPEISYYNMFESIKQRDPETFSYTIEFYPEEGKYHLDGHRNCTFSCMPNETKKLDERCPECGKRLTVGVHNRVSELADKELGRKPHGHIPYKSIIPLAEIIAECVGSGKKSKRVMNLYTRAINSIGDEFHILLDADIDAISRAVDPFVAEGIRRMRDGHVLIDPGYDGLYGVIQLFSDEEKEGARQGSLF